MLLSVVVCTRNRPAGLARAIASVTAQELTGLPPLKIEVIVVNDGSDPPARPPSDEPLPIRLVRIDAGRPGAARKAGLDAAAGDLVAYCDDDDEWLSDHLRLLLPPLLADPETLLVGGDPLWEPPGIEATDETDDHFSPETQVHSSDVVHRAEPARAMGGFDPALEAWEDRDLWARLSWVGALRRVPVVVTRHTGGPDRVGTEPHPADEAYVRLEQAARCVHAKRGARVWPRSGPMRFDLRTWSDEGRRLLAQLYLNKTRSFGIVGRRLLFGLEARGIDVNLGPLPNRRLPEIQRFLGPIDRKRLGFHLDFAISPAAMGCERVVHFATWESTLVPRDKVDAINRGATLLLVPCKQNVVNFAACGVTVPIRIMAHGVDADRFPLLRRPEREPFTIGTYGDLTPRKGIDLLLRAFGEEFRPEEPVRLIIKQTFADQRYGIAWPERLNPRIELRTGFLPDQRLRAFLRELDLFVLPSRGEGFGLPALEAMATGLPTIATNWSGPADYLDPADSFPLAYRLTDANGARGVINRYFGQWAEPDVDHLRHSMRWAYEHRTEAAAMGRAASARVHRDWTWDRVVDGLVAMLDATAQGITPPES